MCDVTSADCMKLLEIRAGERIVDRGQESDVFVILWRKLVLSNL